MKKGWVTVPAGNGKVLQIREAVEGFPQSSERKL